MIENKVCVYAITKNEMKFVDKWVESMKEADSIVVLDTGSTDGTPERLKELGVTVEVKIIDPWRFDVARNEAMKLAPEDCNILVSTDLDEVLEPGWAQLLRDNWVKGKHERCNYKYSWSHLSDGSDGRVFGYNKIHSRNWKWRYPVHELLYNPDTNSESFRRDQTLQMFNHIHLHHYPDKTKSRASYLPLLELRAQEDPNDRYGLIYLGHEYYYKRHYEKAIDTLRRVLLNFSDKCTTEETASCYLFIGDCYKELYKQEDNEIAKNKAIVSYCKAIFSDETYIEPYLNLGSLYLDLKDWENSEFIIKQGIKKSHRHYSWLERDTSWSWEPWDLLCLATYYGDKRAESVKYAAKALSFEPENSRLQNNLKLCLENTSSEELIK